MVSSCLASFTVVINACLACSPSATSTAPLRPHATKHLMVALIEASAGPFVGTAAGSVAPDFFSKREHHQWQVQEHVQSNSWCDELLVTFPASTTDHTESTPAAKRKGAPACAAGHGEHDRDASRHGCLCRDLEHVSICLSVLFSVTVAVPTSAPALATQDEQAASCACSS